MPRGNFNIGSKWIFSSTGNESLRDSLSWRSAENMDVKLLK
jgi:hypothetical protein